MPRGRFARAQSVSVALTRLGQPLHRPRRRQRLQGFEAFDGDPIVLLPLAAALIALAAMRPRTSLTRHLGAFVDVEAKSAGWVAGTPYLDRNVSLRIGMSARGW